MGLDTVEIVLRVEEIFSLDLPDDECGQIRTVGDLYHLVMSKLGLKGSIDPIDSADFQVNGRSRFHSQLPVLQPWTNADVWATLVDLIQDQLQVDFEEITPQATFLNDLRCD
jgi:acyl carrier protein